MSEQSPVFNPSMMPKQRPEHPYVAPDIPPKPLAAAVEHEVTTPDPVFATPTEKSKETPGKAARRRLQGPAIEKALTEAFGSNPRGPKWLQRRGRRFNGYRGMPVVDMSAPLPPDDTEA